MVTADVNQSTPSQGGLLPLTPAQIEGPFFRIGAPRRESLIEPGITGERLMLAGRVLTPEGTTIPGPCFSSGCPTTRATTTVGATVCRGIP